MGETTPGRLQAWGSHFPTEVHIFEKFRRKSQEQFVIQKSAVQGKKKRAQSVQLLLDPFKW